MCSLKVTLAELGNSGARISRREKEVLIIDGIMSDYHKETDTGIEFFEVPLDFCLRILGGTALQR